ncbi:hydrophobic surface binding protein [Mycena vulgaris]|nr:hydrophobic surface binding protein [Mycena vulgaris]
MDRRFDSTVGPLNGRYHANIVEVVQIARVLLLLSGVTLGLALLSKRDVVTVENDLNTIEADVVILDNKIEAYPDNGGTLIQASAIYEAATALTTKMNSATVDSLIELVTKEKAFVESSAQLPIGGTIALICNVLKLLNTANSSFCGALLKKFPVTALIPQEATNLKNKLANDITPAIAAYCNV